MARARNVIQLLAMLLALLVCAVHGQREQMGDRARHMRERRVRMANSQVTQLKRDTNTTFRYLNEKTQPFQVTSLPDINFDLGEMYAGRLSAGNDTSKQFFFVYQPTIGEPVNEVTIWFNGGPGCSSLEAFLQENGRFIWGWGQYSATENPYSWVNLTNMLWVEYPLGVGFSTTENVTATSEEETAEDFVNFFRNFLDTFSIRDSNVYVTGESYAGRYVPYVADALIQAEQQAHFNVSGALMYDPVIGQYEYIGATVAAVPYIQKFSPIFNFNSTFMTALADAHESCGYADYLKQYLVYPPAGVQPPLGGSYNTSSDSCDVWSLGHNAAFLPNPCFNVYEITSMCPILSDPLGYPTDLQYQYPGMGGLYFNRSDVKAAIHVPDDISWSECSGPVFAGTGGPYQNGDRSADPIQAVLPRVIEKTGRVLVSHGDFDYDLIAAGTLLSIQNMTWNGLLGFQFEPNTTIDIQLPDLQYAAVFEDSGLGGLDGPGQGIMGVQHYERGLMWAETYQSGHMQPQFQPRVSYRHMQWLLGRIDAL